MEADFFTEQIAQLRKEIAELRVARVGYTQAEVTAVDAVNSTFSAEIPSQEDGATVAISGLATPAHFMPTVGDTVLLALSGAQPIYQPGRIGSSTVGYTELTGAVGDDIATAGSTADTALATADSKNTVTYSTAAASGSGIQAGDLWFQRSGGVVIGSWEWDGDSWEPRTFGDEVLDTLTAGKITSGQIAVGTSIDVGDPAEDHANLDSDRLAFLATADDGSSVEVVRFGRQQGGVDPATGLQSWAISETGAGSFQEMSVTGDPIIQGTPLSEILTPYAKYVMGASRGAELDPANTGGATEVGYYEFTVELEADHLYLMQSSNFWVRPGTGTSRIDVNLRYEVSTDPEVDPPAVSLSSTLFARHVQAEDGTANTLGHGVMFSRIYKFPTYAHFRFLVSLLSFGGSAYIEMGSANTTDADLGVTIEVERVQFWMLDLGAIEWTNRAVTNTGGGAPAAVKRYTYEYTSGWSRWFYGDGSTAGNNGFCYQGQTPHFTAGGNQATQIGGFTRGGGTTLQTDLSGATVEKLEVYLYADHWHYNAGGTATIRYHNNSSPGSLNNYAGQMTIGGWARDQGRWVNITSWASLFQGTGAKGIQVGPAPSTDPTYYGYFAGPNTAREPRLRCTFTK